MIINGVATSLLCIMYKRVQSSNINVLILIYRLVSILGLSLDDMICTNVIFFIIKFN